jgi:DNA invertase Pin-like site-specific DNA recombinase
MEEYLPNDKGIAKGRSPPPLNPMECGIFCMRFIEELLGRQVGFRAICDGTIDTTTASGELMFHIFSALAQFERRLIQERTRAGLAAARARGKQGGRKPRHAEEPRVRMAYTMYVDQHLSVTAICQTLRISQAMFYRYSPWADTRRRDRDSPTDTPCPVQEHTPEH